MRVTAPNTPVTSLTFSVTWRSRKSPVSSPGMMCAASPPFTAPCCSSCPPSGERRPVLVNRERASASHAGDHCTMPSLPVTTMSSHGQRRAEATGRSGRGFEYPMSEYANIRKAHASEKIIPVTHEVKKELTTHFATL